MISVSKNIFWLTASRALAFSMLAGAYFLLFRYLEPRGTGQHQFVLSYVSVFAVIVDFGIQQYIIKKISEQPNRAKTYFHNFLAVEIVLATFVYGSMLLLARVFSFEPVVQYGIAVAGLGTFINALTYPFFSVMSAFGDLKRVALINFINSLINVGFILATIFFHKYIVFLVANQAAFGIISLALYYRFIKRHIAKPDVFGWVIDFDFGLIKKIIKAALPFALLVGFSTLYNRIDIVLIKSILGFEQTGLYAAAYKFFDVIAFFPSVVSLSLYPVFVSLMAKGNISAIRNYLERYTRFMIALAIPMAVGGGILAGKIILLVAGAGYAGSDRVLVVLIWAPAVLFCYVVFNALVISQLTKQAVAVTAVNVLLNIAGNIVLLPKIGIIAAGAMTVASELLQGVFYFYFVRKKITKFTFFSYLLRPAIASLVMATALWPVKDLPLTLSVTFGGGVYVLTLYCLNFFLADDWQFIKSFFKKDKEVVHTLG